MGEAHETGFTQIFSITYPKDTVIQFFCYASENIRPYLDAYRAFHTHTPDVDHPEILHEIIRKRADFFEKASEEGFWPGVRYRPGSSRITSRFSSLTRRSAITSSKPTRPQGMSPSM